MPVLRININGRYYDITCEKNKEKHVLQLSEHFDQKVKNLSVKLKNVDHSRLLVLTGILLTEELNNLMKDKILIKYNLEKLVEYRIYLRNCKRLHS